MAGRAVAALLILLLLIPAGLRLAAAWREDETGHPAATRMIATPLGQVAAATSGPEGGPSILLIHGTAGWSGFWRDVSTHLAARGWRVIAVDLPPFGFSEHDPKARYDRFSQARRLSAVLGEAAAGPAVVVGHSFGAGAATELALRFPGRVKSLVLVDAALGELDPAPAAPTLTDRALGTGVIAQPLVSASVTNPWALGPLVRMMVARKESIDPWLVTLRQPMRREGTTAAYAAWLPNLFLRDDGGWSRRSERIAAIRVPVALIWGEADTVTPIAQGERIAELTKARSFARLPGLGHIPHIEDPAAFLAALDGAVAVDRERR